MVRGAGWVEVLFEVVSVRLWVTALVFRKLCVGVTHPLPLSRGEIWDAVFLLVMSDLWRGCFPSREGIKGCVMVRGAAGVEVLRDTVSGSLACELSARLLFLISTPYRLHPSFSKAKMLPVFRL